MLNEPPKDHERAKHMVRNSSYTSNRFGKNLELALIRDNHRCCLSGIVDESWALKQEQEDNIQEINRTMVTHCVHIFSRSTTRDADNSLRNTYAPHVLEIFRRYGDVDIEMFVDGDALHLGNILTLSAAAHDNFNKLYVWLEPTSVEHSYKVGSRYRVVQINYPKEVNLTSTVQGLPLPDPKLLALHAACARICMMSGAGEHIDHIFREMEEMKVLAHDGGSAALLYAALATISVH